MKRTTILFLAVVISGMLLIGCGKQPTEKMNTAKSAVDAVIADGAEKYAPEDAKKLNDELTAALDEIKIQDGKMMKNYGKAEEMLAKVEAAATALKTSLPIKKEEAKNNALAAQEAAKTAIDDAKKLLSKAPKGKGSRADIEAMKADVNGLEDSLAEVQAAVDTEDYAVATEKSKSIQEKAAEVSSQITQAMEKVAMKTKTK